MIGEIPNKMLLAMFDSIPMEFSIVDENDKVVAWNKHETRIFRRPLGVIGKTVQKCHPNKSLDKVETILSEMKENKRDKARFWIDLQLDGFDDKQKILIEYYALRDEAGNYLGCMEVSQNITAIKQIEGEKRLLD
jgi:PAS domain S-box-containing protein